MNLCMITGCALIDVPHQRWVWGDLYYVGGAWVFNGETAWNTCQTAWNTGQCPHALSIVSMDGNYFERRGVIVLDSAVLSDDAEKYCQMHGPTESVVPVLRRMSKWMELHGKCCEQPYIDAQVHL